ncbi:MAG TPA: hypothetical protein VFX29_00955 [Longimicrobiaceae bacterium]|jgi:hypothetical protein|nr:hypothetical protein [Longimicrobiaceae bacterium]
MNATERYVDVEGGFDIEVPPGWTAEPDEEEGGVELSRVDGAGILHVLGVPQPPGEVADPADELYAFLAEQGIELEEDDVEDLELADGVEMAVCEFISEDEDAEDEDAGPAFWMVGVATAPAWLVFATYSCAAGEEEQERAAVHALLRSIRPLASG